MKNLSTFLIILCVGHTLLAQNKYEDSLRLESTIEWLEDKLTYNYYNESDDEWWINRFTFNESSETVTIKNIASPHLEAVSDKTYLQLNFRLEELNPYTIQVSETESNTGRLVKGKTIRIGAFDKSIKRVKNGRLSTNQSFIYLSIPSFLEDSAQNYSETIAQKLEEVIRLSTRVYNQDHKSNMNSLKRMLHGQFVEESGTRWVVNNLFDNVIELTVSSKTNELVAKHVISLGDQLEVTSISNAGLEQHQLERKDGPEINYSDGTLGIKLINTNEFIWDNTIPTVLIRDWTAEYDSPKYR